MILATSWPATFAWEPVTVQPSCYFPPPCLLATRRMYVVPSNTSQTRGLDPSRQLASARFIISRLRQSYRTGRGIIDDGAGLRIRVDACCADSTSSQHPPAPLFLEHWAHERPKKKRKKSFGRTYSVKCIEPSAHHGARAIMCPSPDARPGRLDQLAPVPVSSFFFSSRIAGCVDGPRRCPGVKSNYAYRGGRGVVLRRWRARGAAVAGVRVRAHG